MKPQHKKIYLIGPLLDQMDSIQIESADLVIFIDAAISYRDRVHFTCKSISLGDGDGIPWDKGDLKKNDKESYKGSYKERLDILAPTEKDESDFKLALNHIETQFPSLPSIEITAIGLWGGRLDHQISIFGEFISFLNLQKNKSEQEIIVTFHNHNLEKVAYLTNRSQEDYSHHGLFSLFCLEKQKFNMTGQVKYPLNDQFLSPLSSHGLSNEAHGEFKIESDQPYLIIFP